MFIRLIIIISNELLYAEFYVRVDVGVCVCACVLKLVSPFVSRCEWVGRVVSCILSFNQSA